MSLNVAVISVPYINAVPSDQTVLWMLFIARTEDSPVEFLTIVDYDDCWK